MFGLTFEKGFKSNKWIKIDTENLLKTVSKNFETLKRSRPIGNKVSHASQ